MSVYNFVDLQKFCVCEDSCDREDTCTILNTVGNIIIGLIQYLKNIYSTDFELYRLPFTKHTPAATIRFGTSYMQKANQLSTLN